MKISRRSAIVGGCAVAAAVVMIVMTVMIDNRNSKLGGLKMRFEWADRERLKWGQKTSDLRDKLFVVESDLDYARARQRLHLMTIVGRRGDRAEKPTNTVQSVKTNGVTCSGPIGVISDYGRFGQWLFDTPFNSRSRVLINIPDGQRLTRDSISLGSWPSVVSAEICPVMDKDGYADGMKWVLWLSMGMNTIHDRKIIELGGKTKGKMVIRKSYVEAAQIPRSGTHKLFDVVMIPPHGQGDEVIMTTVEFVVKP